ncbi:unnamed protein product [Arctia plantaginis]|uniref:Uncharacterized protein n=1 Tax=Arctia plantaginis TaxID=874455 RepID=A0A8S0ZKZ6_ARCPL|nr:unnamed protein product [Arctia plantaginis]
MNRIVLTLCLFSRVIYGSNSEDHVDFHTATRQPRSPAVPSEDGYVFNQFSDSSGMYAMFASENTKHNPYTGLDLFEFKSSDKLGLDTPHYSDISSLPDIVHDSIPTHTVSPLTYDTNYEISKAKSDAKYAELANKYTPLDVKSDGMMQNLKSMMHYAPPEHDTKDSFSSYEIHTDYHNDDDDVRSSGRTMYDTYWPHIYHSPYEYEYKKGISDLEKAKDKRYVDESLIVKPVYEHIDNDIPSIDTEQLHIETSTDNPIGGNGPFFSFVLNDYFDRNKDEDPISFKGIDVDWGKEFDHESYRPSVEDVLNSQRERRLQNNYVTPLTQWLTTARPLYMHARPIDSENTGKGGDTRSPNTMIPFTKLHLPIHGPLDESSPSIPLSNNYLTSVQGLQKDEGMNKNHDSEKRNIGKNSYSNDKTGYNANEHKYEGFKDFLDSFANKFGSEDHKKDASYEKENNENKGQKKKGFHRIYHKDEFQEDNEFYDDSNNASKAKEKGKSKVHIGGSEAFLRSQALGSAQNAENSLRKSGNMGDGKFENDYKVHDGSNTKGNKFVKFIDVAKQAAKSNNADYLDTYRA